MARSSRLCDWTAITIPEYPRGGSTKAYSIQGVYITRHRIVAHLSSITRGSRPSRFGQSVWNSNSAISPYHCFALFEICKRIEGFSLGSQRSSTHEPCPLGISVMLDMCHNEAWKRLDERILSKRVLGIVERLE